MTPSSRAIRRNHLDRMKAKARRVYPDDPRAIKLANHLKHCDCSACTPDRGLSIQERRAALTD